jgi:hypothetical protein
MATENTACRLDRRRILCADVPSGIFYVMGEGIDGFEGEAVEIIVLPSGHFSKQVLTSSTQAAF